MNGFMNYYRFRAFARTIQEVLGTYAAAQYLRAMGVSLDTARRILLWN